MTIRAVVFDIGGVLEITDDRDLSPEWENRLGLSPGSLGRNIAHLWAAGSIGTMSYAELVASIEREVGLSSATVAAFMEDIWT